MSGHLVQGLLFNTLRKLHMVQELPMIVVTVEKELMELPSLGHSPIKDYQQEIKQYQDHMEVYFVLDAQNLESFELSQSSKQEQSEEQIKHQRNDQIVNYLNLKIGFSDTIQLYIICNLSEYQQLYRMQIFSKKQSHLSCDLSKSKHQFLQQILIKISNRYNSVLFSKLVLYEPDKNSQTQDSRVHYVRHYDLECEGAHIIKDLLQTKIKAVQFRFFDGLKEKFTARRSEKQNQTKKSNNQEKLCQVYSLLTLGASSSSLPDSHKKNILNLDFRERKSQHFEPNVSNFACKFDKNYIDPQNSRCQSQKLKKRKEILYRLKNLQKNLREYVTQSSQMSFTTRSNYEIMNKKMNQTMETRTDRLFQSSLRLRRQ